MRQIRSCEAQRDDPLVDDALHRLSIHVTAALRTGSPLKEVKMSGASSNGVCTADLSEERLRQDGARALRRLRETGAILVIAPAMDKAVIVREVEGREPVRMGIVDKPLAEAMALKGWIQCRRAGRITRYEISRAGREALAHLLHDVEQDESDTAFGQEPEAGSASAMAADQRARRKRYGTAETPLSGLARRKDVDGKPFLSGELVRAGERLREDFELAQMGPRMSQNWERYLTGGVSSPCGGSADQSGGANAARERVAGALRDLGPGLGDVALRCCCYLEGLERIEKRMAWSARSGKIVLRIALQRLKRHYDTLGAAGGLMG
jgi:hypothetical protein